MTTSHEREMDDILGDLEDGEIIELEPSPDHEISYSENQSVNGRNGSPFIVGAGINYAESSTSYSRKGIPDAPVELIAPNAFSSHEASTSFPRSKPSNNDEGSGSGVQSKGPKFSSNHDVDLRIIAGGGGNTNLEHDNSRSSSFKSSSFSDFATTPLGSSPFDKRVEQQLTMTSRSPHPTDNYFLPTDSRSSKELTMESSRDFLHPVSSSEMLSNSREIQDLLQQKTTPPTVRYSEVTYPTESVGSPLVETSSPVDPFQNLSQEEKDALYIILSSLSQFPSANSEDSVQPVRVIPLEPVEADASRIASPTETQKNSTGGFWARLKPRTGDSPKYTEANAESVQPHVLSGDSFENAEKLPIDDQIKRARIPDVIDGTTSVEPSNDSGGQNPPSIKELLSEFGKLSSEIQSVEQEKAEIEHEKVMLLAQVSHEDDKPDKEAPVRDEALPTEPEKTQKEDQDKEEGEESTADDEDEEELLEMQLRLQALESTLKGRSAASTSVKPDTEIDLEDGELPPGAIPEKDKSIEPKEDSTRSASPTPEELVNKKIAERLPFFHKSRKGDIKKIAEITKSKPRISDRVVKRAEERRRLVKQPVSRKSHRSTSSRNSRSNESRRYSSSARRREPRRSSKPKPPSHPPRSPVLPTAEISKDKQKTRFNKWQQLQREKILRTEDPNTQLQEFYKLLTTKTQDLANSNSSTETGHSSRTRKRRSTSSKLESPITPSQRDNFDICSMDIEDDSQETPDLMPEDMPAPPGVSPPPVYPLPLVHLHPQPAQLPPPIMQFPFGPPLHLGANSLLPPIYLPPPPPPPPLPAYEPEGASSTKDPSPDIVVSDEEPDAGEDEMEALRQLALASLQKKKTAPTENSLNGGSLQRSVKVLSNRSASDNSTVRVTVEQDVSERLVVMPVNNSKSLPKKKKSKAKALINHRGVQLKPSNSKEYRPQTYAATKETEHEEDIQVSLRYVQGPVVIELGSDDSDWEGTSRSSKKDEKVSNFLDDFLKRVREKTDKVKAAQKPASNTSENPTDKSPATNQKSISSSSSPIKLPEPNVPHAQQQAPPAKKSPRTRTTSNSGEYVAALKTRLQLCENDMEKNKKTLTEDRARMKILNAALKKHETDLLMSEKKARKLKEELAAVTRIAATHRKTMTRLKREKLLVNARVNQNETIEKTYEDIKNLLSKKDPAKSSAKDSKKISESVPKPNVNRKSEKVTKETPIKQKTPPAPSRIESLTATAAKLEEHKRKLTRMSQECVKKLQKIQKAKLDGAMPLDKDTVSLQTQSTGKKTKNEGKENVVDELFTAFHPSASERQSTTSPKVIKSDESPLLQFRAYRISPQFSSLWSKDLFSSTYSHCLDPSIPLCPFSISGTCSDAECKWQHESDYQLDSFKLAADLIAYFPSFARVVETPPQDYRESVKLFMQREFPEDELSPEESLPLLLRKLRAASMEAEGNFPFHKFDQKQTRKNAETDKIPEYNRLEFNAKRKRYF